MNVLQPQGAKPIWRRSGVLIGGACTALKAFAPEAPWWAYLILVGVGLVVSQVWAPSVPAKALKP